MYSCTERIRPGRPGRPGVAGRAARRGTAVTETLLIIFPLWIFFMLVMYVLTYWEQHHLDRTVLMENAFAKQTLTTVVFDTGSKERLCNPDYKDDFQFWLEDVSGGDDKLPLYKVYVSGYVSDKSYLKLMTVRGNNSWLSFLWLRGQYFGDSEQGKRVKWYDKTGNAILNKARKPLMLGS